MKKTSIYKHYKSEMINRNTSNTPYYWFIFKDNKILVNSFKTGVKIVQIQFIQEFHLQL
jgi:ribonuclease HIII